MFLNPYSEENLTNILSKLTEQSKPEWGTMDAQQMIEHLTLVIEVSMNKHSATQHTPEDKIERAQQFLFSDLPMPRYYKAPFVPETGFSHQYSSLDEAKEMLKAQLLESVDFFNRNPDIKTLHPVFGMLTAEGWLRVQEKHFTHHFTQFNLV
ncbi:MAG TPA: DUF1569 domain-containing protein [Bacteroidia bacterium]|nr:DUF1569 domain-containing protein [Bacteroidia bacterium]HNT79197.1 DUF1569 domain-containing protein [Bacteroidia bacterium]